MMRTVKHRVLANVFANAFGQGVAVVAQLIIVPVAVRWWGVTQYGEWLTLSAIPSVLSWAEFGLASATANRICMLVSANKRTEAQLLFSHLLGWLTTVCAVLGLGWIIIVPFAAGWYGRQITILSPADLRLTLSALGISLLLALFQGGLQVTFRANGRNHQGLILWNIHRLIELAVTLIVIATGGGILLLASSQLALRILVGVIGWRLSSGPHDVLKNRIGRVRWRWLRQDAPQAAGFIGMTITNGLQFSVTTILVGTICGPAILVAFTAVRTLTRIPLQIGSILNNSLLPEITIARGAGNRDRLQRMFKVCISQASVFAISSVIIVPLAGPYLLKYWTNGNISSSWKILLLASSTCAASQVGGAFVAFLYATNEHVRYATVSLGIYLVVCVMLPFFLPGYGLVVAFSFLLVAEATTAVYGISEVKRRYQFRWAEMLPTFEMPFPLLKRHRE